MQIVYSKHWLIKKQYRKGITDELIMYAINGSPVLRDKHWPDVLNAIARVPPSGRIMKVVYKKLNGKIKIITAFWLD